MLRLDSMLRVPKGFISREDIEGSFLLHDRSGDPFPLFEETDTEWLLPRFAGGRFSYPIQYIWTKGRPLPETPKLFRPRDNQEDAVVSTIAEIQKNSGCILSAKCGTGKTVMGAEIARRLGVSTCVLVHKEFLEDQWEEAFTMLAPDLQVGRLRRDSIDTGDTHDIVIASTQSITNPKREYPQEFYASFGFLILDEVHRYGGRIWHESIKKFPSKYRLGLTATPYRQDGLWELITYHIGQIGYELKTELPDNRVYFIRIETEIPKEYYEIPWLSPEMQRGKLITEIANHEGRNAVIARNILKAIKASRKILVISERKSQLSWLKNHLLEQGVPPDRLGVYVGGASSKKDVEERNASLDRQVILTTYQMTKEGFDLEELDTLFMASPQYDVVQTVGRILRTCEGKKLPTTIDFVDVNVERLRNQAFGRLKQYRKMGCQIHGSL